MGEPTQQVDEFGAAKFVCVVGVGGAGFIGDRQGRNVARAEAGEPIGAIAPGPVVVVIGRGCGGDDAHGGIEAACQRNRLQVGPAHSPAKFGTTFEQDVSHVITLAKKRNARNVCRV